jgi:hypothetical protein
VGGIVWLASYPKSGNTWMRAFLTNLLNEQDEQVDINHLKTDGIFSSREIFDSVTGIEASNLTGDEIDSLRPVIYNHLSETAEKTMYLKAHDAYTRLADGRPLFGTENARAIYILRNPLDVAVSYANHMSKDLDTAIRLMGDKSHAMCGNRHSLNIQLRQRLLTWSGHVESWTEQRDIPMHLIRYEDMKLDPMSAFTGVVRFLEIACSEGQIARAVELSGFSKLKALEQENGFHEKPLKVKSFFRKGEVGDWRNHLSEAQRDRLIADHGQVMRAFGYLDANGKSVF